MKEKNERQIGSLYKSDIRDEVYMYLGLCNNAHCFVNVSGGTGYTPYPDEFCDNHYLPRNTFPFNIFPKCFIPISYNENFIEDYKRDILSKIAYGLKVYSEDGSVLSLNGQFSGDIVSLKEGLSIKMEDNKTYVPILFPIELLDKEITIKGKTFIPIKELALIEGKCTGSTSFGYSTGKYTIISEEYKFGFDSEASSFFVEDLSTGAPLPVCNVLALYEAMDKWKIDYKGWIRKEEAVSVYDIKEHVSRVYA